MLGNPLAGILSDPSSQIGLRRPYLIGKRSLAEFQQHQQLQQAALYLRNVKPRPYIQQTSPISPLSPMDFSPEISWVSNKSSTTSWSSFAGYGVPILSQLRPQSLNLGNGNFNSMMGVSLPNLIAKQAPGNQEMENKIMNRMQELAKQLLLDEEDGENDAVSVVTNSEWSETIQNLLGPGQTAQKPETTVSPSPATVCPKQLISDAASAISDGKSDSALEILTRLNQDSVCTAMAIEAADGGGKFKENVWSRPGGGGGISRVSSDGGGVWENAVVNVSNLSRWTLIRRIPDPVSNWTLPITIGLVIAFMLWRRICNSDGTRSSTAKEVFRTSIQTLHTPDRIRALPVVFVYVVLTSIYWYKALNSLANKMVQQVVSGALDNAVGFCLSKIKNKDFHAKPLCTVEDIMSEVAADNAMPTPMKFLIYSMVLVVCILVIGQTTDIVKATKKSISVVSQKIATSIAGLIIGYLIFPELISYLEHQNESTDKGSKEPPQNESNGF